MGGRSLTGSVALILAGAALTSCAPSSLIMTTARKEDRIFAAKSDRQHREKYLSSPLAVDALVPPVLLRDFDFSSLHSSPSSEFRTHSQKGRVLAFCCTWSKTTAVSP